MSQISADRAALNSSMAFFCASVSLSAGMGGIRSCAPLDAAMPTTMTTSGNISLSIGASTGLTVQRRLTRDHRQITVSRAVQPIQTAGRAPPANHMWETALGFAIWGSYGTVLTIAHIDPVLTAIARSAAVGIS